jgi:O-antigen/teichoic acid export membrane protein
MKKKGDFSRVFNNSFFLITNDVIDAIVNFAIIAILARYFDLNTFGNYCFIFALCNIFQALTVMGINAIIIREVARKPEEGRKLFDASFFTRVLFSFIAFGSIALSINISSSSTEVIHATYVCAIGVITLIFCNLPFSIFKGYQRMEFVTMVGVVNNTVYLLTTIAFVKLSAGLREIFFPVIIGNLFGFLFGLYIVIKKFFIPKLSIDLKLCQYIVKESYLLGIGRVLRQLSFRFDTILLNMIRGSIEVALFSGAYRIFLQLAVFPRNIVTSVFPIFSKKYAKRTASLNFAFEECFKIFIIFLIPLIIFLFFFAKDIVMLLYGEKLLKSVPVFKILTIGWGFMSISILFMFTLIAIGKQNLTTLSIALALIVNVILDIILIPITGFYGAGVATLVAEAVLTFSTYKFISKYLTSLSFYRLLLGPATGGALFAFSCYLGNKMSSVAALFLVTIVGFFGYVGLLIVFKTLTSEEYEWGEKVFRDLFKSRALATDSKLLNPGEGSPGKDLGEE